MLKLSRSRFLRRWRTFPYDRQWCVRLFHLRLQQVHQVFLNNHEAGLMTLRDSGKTYVLSSGVETGKQWNWRTARLTTLRGARAERLSSKTPRMIEGSKGYRREILRSCEEFVNTESYQIVLHFLFLGTSLTFPYHFFSFLWPAL